MSQKEDALEQRKADATSDETVDDVEQPVNDDGSGSNPDPGPSPDGRLDDPDEIKDAGPM